MVNRNCKAVLGFVSCSLGGLLVKEMLAKGLADGAAPHHRCAPRARCSPYPQQGPICEVADAVCLALPDRVSTTCETYHEADTPS